MMQPSLFIISLLLSSLALAADPLSANYDVDPDTGLRMDRYRAPVPADIPGGITLDTQSATLAHESQDVIFIDVYPPAGLGPDPLDGHWVTNETRDSIPGAIWLPEIGRGTLTPEAVDYFKRNLARLTSNQPNKPIAFFCTSDCWQSWNAARRAINWGYSAVHWYPLGSDGWIESGQTLSPIQPVNFLDDTTPASDNELAKTKATATPKFPNNATIYLIDQNGNELNIGSVMFSTTNEPATGVSVDIESDQFIDQFLSMRPFRCLTDPAEWFCYLPYPYELNNTITTEDMTELEYQLLFIWKSPKDFGIDAWNGVYYQLTLEDNGTISGQLLQGDLNVLANPPEPYSHPIDLDEFIAEDAKNRLYPSLVIRP